MRRRVLRDRAWALWHLLHRPPRLWGLAAEAGLTLLYVKVRMARVPFRRQRGTFLASTLSEHRIERRRVAEVSWAVDRTSRLAPHVFSCLPRAVAAQSMLRRRGTEAVMCFGVRRTDEGELTAHAWLEMDGEVIMGMLPALDAYQRLPSWPGNAG